VPQLSAPPLGSPLRSPAQIRDRPVRRARPAASCSGGREDACTDAGPWSDPGPAFVPFRGALRCAGSGRSGWVRDVRLKHCQRGVRERVAGPDGGACSHSADHFSRARAQVFFPAAVRFIITRGGRPKKFHAAESETRLRPWSSVCLPDPRCREDTEETRAVCRRTGRGGDGCDFCVFPVYGLALFV